MRDARPNMDQQAKAVAMHFKPAHAITYVDRLNQLHQANSALAGLDFATLNVGINVAIKAVRKSFLAEVDIVSPLPIRYCANVNTLAKFVLMFLE
ncbi:unnamed protein product [Microthlaspi erraticum]|uniref:Uncharacterized protein n=1 Tax=Microthlaspi erraticum TaxID=1685480 RepID=A0A6D2KHV0_9BRAS|nr:unnamed protein product [Microthlaspi erraticum]